MTSTNILLAEDDVVVATDLAIEMEASGLGLAAITGSVEGVLKWIDAEDGGFAVLNVNLQDGVIYPAAKRLRALGIPFAFLTSLKKDEIDLEFWDVPHLSKPHETSAIARFVADLVGALPPGPGCSGACGKAIAR